jgi:hypothetical protein
MNYDYPINKQIGVINFVMNIHKENLKLSISKLNIQKLSLKYYLCMICCNANYYNYIKQVYKGLMIDYLIFFTLDGDCSSDPPNICNIGVSTVTKCMHLVSNINRTPCGLQPNDRTRVFEHPDSQDSTENGNHMPKSEVHSLLKAPTGTVTCEVSYSHSGIAEDITPRQPVGKQLPKFQPNVSSSKCKQPFTGNWGVTPENTWIFHDATCLFSIQNVSWTQA